MNALPKIYMCGLLVCLSIGCKRNDEHNAQAETAISDSAASETDTAVGDNADPGNASDNLKKRRATRALTQSEIDSIKAERDKIVTPPDNTGASATPGSGRAVPSNDKIAPGNNASQGSSTGNVEVKK